MDAFSHFHRCLAVFALAVLAESCFSRGEVPMAVVPPPSDWAGQIAAERAAKDRGFKTDPDTPLLAADVEAFRGLEYWPPDPSYRYVGPIHVYESPQRITIITTTGIERPCERYGRVTFDLNEKRCTLQVYRLLDLKPEPGGSGLFLPFTDGTTGKETYPAGRYIDLEGPDGGPYVMDFNRAYNPLCAYGAPARFRCPVTPAENRLPVRVESGERGYKHVE